MKQAKWLMISILIQAIMICLSVTILETKILPFFLGSYLLFVFVLSRITRRKGFVLLVCVVLILALSFLFIGFLNGLDTPQQLIYILRHMFFTLNGVITYFTVYIAKRLEEDNERLKTKVDLLTSYVGDTKLLTEQEFQERMNLILKAMERREESGYLILFSLENIPSHTTATIYDTLTEKALQTFRNDYDLVGRKDDISFMVFLQNTNAVGLNIALDRYAENVKADLEMDVHEIIHEIQALGIAEGQVA
ncbi:hypothetical protein SAMN02745975_03442 [Geosporobacter subterraneus DSM 17957]|uniref:GGDEF domain-containing protein, diguanylate cyclase (C-di-GMP synthetase) or its enzymatically inactive variants n=1 Tax=Geosporobacter subterraneus DSM 17957 TaxID=1121919 RepID=A0A1M6NZ92_9FIRM|nr:hypothetical protein [Geosporobacter subterraneus]SHK00974.1 hypothetical protein SAMN02745975_03442 [Geosporobacter subterraneus DSM 17957]